MTIHRILDDAAALGRTDDRVDRLLAPRALTSSAAATPTVALATAAATGTGAAGQGTVVLWAGTYELGTETFSFTVERGRERKHYVPQHRFETLYQARAEAAASSRTCAIMGAVGRYRVYETNQPAYFLPNELRNLEAGGFGVELFVNHRPRAVEYEVAGEALRPLGEEARVERMAALLVEHFEFDPAELHVPTDVRLDPARINLGADDLAVDGSTSWVDAEGHRTSFPGDRTTPLPRPAITLQASPFMAHRLRVWRTLVHEESHQRFALASRRLVEAWRQLPAQDTPSFVPWLALQHEAGATIDSIQVTDEVWLTTREHVRALAYDGNPAGRYLNEALAYFQGFAHTFNNLPIDVLRPDYFVDLDRAEVNWFASHWDAEVPGFSQKLVARWATYIKAMDAAHLAAIIAYIEARTPQPDDAFFPALRAELGV